MARQSGEGWTSCECSPRRKGQHHRQLTRSRLRHVSESAFGGPPRAFYDSSLVTYGRYSLQLTNSSRPGRIRFVSPRRNLEYLVPRSCEELARQCSSSTACERTRVPEVRTGLPSSRWAYSGKSIIFSCGRQISAEFDSYSLA